MHGLVEDHRRAGAEADPAGVERGHLAALPLEAVVRVVTAQLLDEDVDDVVARGGRAPREVLPAARARTYGPGARERRAARVDPAAVHVDLVQHLRVEVADLRPGHEERVAGGRAVCAPTSTALLADCCGLLRDRGCCGRGGVEAVRVDDGVAVLVAWLWVQAELPSIETEVSGSFCSRRSFQTCSPLRSPSRSWSADRSCERRASSPPPLPNTAPISAATAITSLRVQGRPVVPACVRKSLMPAR